MAQVAHPSVNTIQEQGLVAINASYDSIGRRQDAAANRLRPSLYDGVERDNVHHIAPGGLCFSIPGSSKGARVAVRDALNGVGAEAAYYYKEHPEMFVEAVRNRIQFIGAAVQQLNTGNLTEQLGVAVQVAGLRSLVKSNDGQNIEVGDLAFADLPSPTGAPLASGSVLGQGRSAYKWTLQLRRAQAMSPGRKIRMHILEILDDPRRWKNAMGAHLAGQKIWATAAHQIMNSYLTAVVLGARVLVASKLLVPAPDSIARFFGPASDTAGRDGAALQQAADNVASRLAILLGLVRGNTTLNGDALDNGNEYDKSIKALRARVLHTIFYDGTRTPYEIGHSRDGADHVFLGRDETTRGRVRTGTPIGDLLQLQLQHFPRGAASLWAAQLQFMRFLVGKAASPGNKQTPQLNVMLGQCRP